jgi:hypothetical protein
MQAAGGMHLPTRVCCMLAFICMHATCLLVDCVQSTTLDPLWLNTVSDADDCVCCLVAALFLQMGQSAAETRDAAANKAAELKDKAADKAGEVSPAVRQAHTFVGFGHVSRHVAPNGSKATRLLSWGWLLRFDCQADRQRLTREGYVCNLL